MKTLFILSMIVPVGLLAMFRLTGVLKQPAEAERITVDPVTLTLTRPTETVDNMNKTFQNQWTQKEASIIAGATIYSYREGAAGEPFCGHDGLVLNVFANASFPQGYISSMSISLNLSNDSSIVVLDMNPWSLQLINATLTSTNYFGTNETGAYIKANVLKQSCCIADQIFWVFLDEDGSHELQINVEVTFFGETSSEIITIPLKLEMTPSEGE
jgi:hypothetical protein